MTIDWQPIEFFPDSLKDDETEVLIWDENGFAAVVYWSKANWGGGEEFGWTHDGGDRYDPTHFAMINPPNE